MAEQELAQKVAVAPPLLPILFGVGPFVVDQGGDIAGLELGPSPLHDHERRSERSAVVFALRLLHEKEFGKIHVGSGGDLAIFSRVSRSAVSRFTGSAASALTSRAACSTADPTSRYHILNRVPPTSSKGFLSIGLPSKIVYSARMI